LEGFAIKYHPRLSSKETFGPYPLEKILGLSSWKDALGSSPSLRKLLGSSLEEVPGSFLKPSFKNWKHSSLAWPPFIFEAPLSLLAGTD
jgi:hypothetical protein